MNEQLKLFNNSDPNEEIRKELHEKVRILGIELYSILSNRCNSSDLDDGRPGEGFGFAWLSDGIMYLHSAINRYNIRSANDRPADYR